MSEDLIKSIGFFEKSVLAVAKDKVVCQNFVSLAKVFFITVVSCVTRKCPTKRAPDAGDSGAIPSLFLRLSIFPVGRRPAARPARVTQIVRCLLR